MNPPFRKAAQKSRRNHSRVSQEEYGAGVAAAGSRAQRMTVPSPAAVVDQERKSSFPAEETAAPYSIEGFFLCEVRFPKNARRKSGHAAEFRREIIRIAVPQLIGDFLQGIFRMFVIIKGDKASVTS